MQTNHFLMIVRWKKEFAFKRYGASKFSIVMEKLMKASKGSALSELKAVGYDKLQKKLTVAQQEIIIKYLH